MDVFFCFISQEHSNIYKCYKYNMKQELSLLPKKALMLNQITLSLKNRYDAIYHKNFNISYFFTVFLTCTPQNIYMLNNFRQALNDKV